MEQHKTVFILLIFFGLSVCSYSQSNNNVGIGTLTPHSSALLDIDAGNTNKGLLIPRLTATQRLAISSPANSLLVFDTDSACFFYWNAVTTNWKSLCSLAIGVTGATGSTGAIGSTGATGAIGSIGFTGATGADGSLNAWSLTGNDSTNTNTHFIGTIDSVDFVAKTNNTERFKITANGNVGIGTSSVVNKLDVEGGLAIGSNYAGSSIAPGNGAIIEGNVGIGTNAPTSLVKMHLYNNVNYANELKIENPNAGTVASSMISLYNNSGTGKLAFIQYGSSANTTYAGNNGLAIGTASAGKMEFYTKNTARVTIDTSGNVGIGTNAPLVKADIRGTNLKSTAASLENIFQVASTDASPLALKIGIKTDGTPTNRYASIDVDDGGTKRNLILAPAVNGNVGIGTTTPVSKLDVNGSATISGNLGINCTSPQYLLHVNGDAGFTGTVYGQSLSMTMGVSTCSDIRYKKDITPLPSALTNIMKVNGVSYYWKVDEFPKKVFNNDKQIGFIAQDLEKIYPEVVFTDKDGYKTVDYSRLTPILVEAIKEQQKIIDTLQEQNNNQYKAQQSLIEAMQKEIEALKNK